MPTDDQTPILVEFSEPSGLVEAARTGTLSAGADDVVAKSNYALSSAMSTIHNMAQLVRQTIDALVDRPDKVEVTFGLKLTAQAGALIAQASTEGSLNVKLSWEEKRG